MSLHCLQGKKRTYGRDQKGEPLGFPERLFSGNDYFTKKATPQPSHGNDLELNILNIESASF